jgi:hypothetical protein
MDLVSGKAANQPSKGVLRNAGGPTNLGSQPETEAAAPVDRNHHVMQVRLPDPAYKDQMHKVSYMAWHSFCHSKVNFYFILTES